jgi:cell wall-associated NlpC family hydrolase
VKTAGYADMTTVTRRLVPLALIITALLNGACAARGGVPRPFPGASVPPSAAEPAPTPPGQPILPVPSLVAAALEFRGVPYRNGGSDPSGFDCSGLVQYVFARFGTSLPREVRDQYRAGDEIDLDDVQPGDLLFFETVSRGASHVGLAVGGGEFVHAPSSRGVVRVERYDSSYWSRRFVGARRVATGTSPSNRLTPGVTRDTR